MRFAQCPYDPEMSKAARSAGAQDETDRFASQEPDESRYVKGVAVANVAKEVERQLLAPASGRRPDILASVVPQDEVNWLAQMIVARYEAVEWVEGDLADSSRGAGGFGSSGR